MPYRLGVPKSLRLDASILDLAPTLQEMLMVEVSQDVDGKTLTPLLRHDSAIHTEN